MYACRYACVNRTCMYVCMYVCMYGIAGFRGRLFFTNFAELLQCAKILFVNNDPASFPDVNQIIIPLNIRL